MNNVHEMMPILYSCIDIYAYSCLKVLSNRPEAVFNPCSNHEICVPLNMVFSRKCALRGILCFNDINLFYIAALLKHL